jgi:hypothetical protein
MKKNAKVNILLLLLASLSINTYANNPSNVSFDISNYIGTSLPKAKDVVVAFTYNAAEAHPGVAMYQDGKYGHMWRPFSIKTDSKTVSVTQAQVAYNMGLYESYLVDTSCKNIAVIPTDNTQFIYFNLDMENKLLSCN